MKPVVQAVIREWEVELAAGDPAPREVNEGSRRVIRWIIRHATWRVRKWP